MISEKEINKHLSKRSTLCYQWAEAIRLSQSLNLITEVFKMGEGMVCVGTNTVRSSTSKENIVFGLGKKDFKIKFKPNMTQMSLVSKTICQKDNSTDFNSVVVF